MRGRLHSFAITYMSLAGMVLLLLSGCVQQPPPVCPVLPEAASSSGGVSAPTRDNSAFDILAEEDIIIEESPVERITIMVHGTNLPLIAAERYAPSWCASTLISWLDSSRGLKPVLSGNHVYEPLARALHAVAPYQFPLENFYFFDWSGKLTAEDRKQAAHELYAAISRLLDEPPYKNAHLTVIGYSHGGNVAVNLGYIAQEKNKDSQKNILQIDRLILLGCPIQEVTQRYVTSPIFKQIYHLYTHADLVQILDTQTPLDEAEYSWYSSLAFSCRTFAPDSSANLVQAKITRNKRSLYHKDFVTASFFHELPPILCTLEHTILRETLPCTAEGIYHVDYATKAQKKRRKRVKPKRPVLRNVRQTMVSQTIENKDTSLC